MIVKLATHRVGPGRCLRCARGKTLRHICLPHEEGMIVAPDAACVHAALLTRRVPDESETARSCIQGRRRESKLVANAWISGGTTLTGSAPADNGKLRVHLV